MYGLAEQVMLEDKTPGLHDKYSKICDFWG